MPKNVISVPVPPPLREFVERAAKREDRSVAAQVRHYLAEAARSSEAATAQPSEQAA